MLLVLAFLGTLLASFAMVAFFTRQTQWERAVQKRVGDIQQASHEDKTRQQDAERILKVDVPGRFHWLDEFLHRYRFSRTLETLSMQAGSNWTAGSFAVYSASASGLAFIAGHFIFPLLVVQAVLGVVGLCAPYLFLKRRRATRLHSFNNALPDAIDLMARALARRAFGQFRYRSAFRAGRGGGPARSSMPFSASRTSGFPCGMPCCRWPAASPRTICVLW